MRGVVEWDLIKQNQRLIWTSPADVKPRADVGCCLYAGKQRQTPQDVSFTERRESLNLLRRQCDKPGLDECFLLVSSGLNDYLLSDKRGRDEFHVVAQGRFGNSQAFLVWRIPDVRDDNLVIPSDDILECIEPFDVRQTPDRFVAHNQNNNGIWQGLATLDITHEAADRTCLNRSCANQRDDQSNLQNLHFTPPINHIYWNSREYTRTH